MVNGKNGHFEFNFVVKFQVDHNGHGQNLDYLTTNIPRFGHGHGIKMTMAADTPQFSLSSQ